MELRTIPNPDELNGVFYDTVDGVYAVLSIDEENEAVNMCDPFDGTLIHDFDVAEFRDEWDNGAFVRVNENALNDPAGFLDEFVSASLSPVGSVDNFDPVTVEFVVEILNFERGDELSAWEEQDGIGRDTDE